MNDPVLLRRTVRKALALRPREELSEIMLKATMERTLALRPDAITVHEFQIAMEWNHGEGHIEYRYDDEAEATYWKLTDQGKAKEGVK